MSFTSAPPHGVEVPPLVVLRRDPGSQQCATVRGVWALPCHGWRWPQQISSGVAELFRP